LDAIARLKESRMTLRKPYRKGNRCESKKWIRVSQMAISELDRAGSHPPLNRFWKMRGFEFQHTKVVAETRLATAPLYALEQCVASQIWTSTFALDMAEPRVQKVVVWVVVKGFQDRLQCRIMATACS
jgi:hypothetical protein